MIATIKKPKTTIVVAKKRTTPVVSKVVKEVRFRFTNKPFLISYFLLSPTSLPHLPFVEFFWHT